MDEAIHDIKKITQAIEAILFAAGYPVTYAKLSEVLGLPAREVKRMAEHMALSYNGEDSERGILLLCHEDTCQLCTREEFAPYIREALGVRRGGNLSASSLEVLSVIAYNQPVTRSYIDTVRGVDSAYAVSSLIDRHLIEPCGRLDAPGRPMLYATTPDFLRVFGLDSLADLPDADALALASATKFDEAQREAAKSENDSLKEDKIEAGEEEKNTVNAALKSPTPFPEEAADLDSLPDPEEDLPDGALSAD